MTIGHFCYFAIFNLVWPWLLILMTRLLTWLWINECLHVSARLQLPHNVHLFGNPGPYCTGIMGLPVNNGVALINSSFEQSTVAALTESSIGHFTVCAW